MADELRIQWNIGNDCNYNCSYCHSDLKNGSNPFPNLDKLRVGFDNIVRQAQPFSLVKMELMGGEITQSPAIKEIMLMNTSPKIDFRIYSNGSADIAWWEEVRPNIYHMDLTYHPSSDLTHFVSVVKAINKIAGKGLNLIIAAAHDNWDKAIEAYKELKPFNPTLQMLYTNFARGNNNYFAYTEAQWEEFKLLTYGPVVKVDKPVEIWAGGTGFMLIKREVFEDLKDKVSSYKNDVTILAGDLGQEPIIEYFACSIEPETERLLSEDYHFCRVARLNGHKIYAAPWVRLGHFGTYLFEGGLLPAP